MPGPPWPFSTAHLAGFTRGATWAVSRHPSEKLPTFALVGQPTALIPSTGELESPSRNPAREMPGKRTGERSELLKPFPLTPCLFQDRSSIPLGPSSSRSTAGVEHDHSDGSHLVAQPLRTHRHHRPKQLARSRGARTEPALTGVKPRVSRRALIGTSSGQVIRSRTLWARN